MDKQNVVYIDHSAFKRKNILTYGITWKNLKDIMLNETSQSQKDKYSSTDKRYLV